MDKVDIVAVIKMAVSALVSLAGAVTALRILMNGTGEASMRFQGWLFKGIQGTVEELRKELEAEVEARREATEANHALIDENRMALDEVRMLSGSSTWESKRDAANEVIKNGWNGHLGTLARLTLDEYQEHLKEERAARMASPKE